MSGDELSSWLFAEQGYVVLNTRNHYEIGKIINSRPFTETSRVESALRIIGPSSREEYLEQERMANQITSDWTPYEGELSGNYYRVEAAD